MNARILVVDDEPDIRILLKDILEDEGYLVDVAEHARAANEIRDSAQPDLVLLDIWMPEIDGVTLLKQWKSDDSDDCPVVMMSGHGTVETAVEATRYGAYDFIEKPLSMAKLLNTVKAALGSVVAAGRAAPLKRENPVGDSKVVQNLRKLMHDLSNSGSPVFFSGADGSGRQIWASYLSGLAFPDQVMQVFDRSQDLARLLPLSSNLYIEEICDLRENQQSSFMQIMQADGASDGFRIIASSRYNYAQLKTHKNLISEIAELWRRAIHIPTLDEHIEDIPEILEYYVNWFSEDGQLPYRHFGVAAQNMLRNHHWHGDILQLKQFIKAVLGNAEDESIEIDEITQLLQPTNQSGADEPANALHLMIDLDMNLRDAREVFERAYLSKHLELCGNNIAELARRVGQERTHLYRKLKSLGLYTKKNN
ncbi:MAG: sigma-54-dependent Fis family transcriptional regulator [Gammaproteobacteria bacterium]|nr:sigma-54-dependent Fis family transcriptional regulator [Gammaproteobacteria bacterium]